MHTHAYNGGWGRGDLNMAKNTHFVCMIIENATISEILKDT